MGKFEVFFAIFIAPLLVGCELNSLEQSIEEGEDLKAFSSMFECLEYVDVCVSYPPLGLDMLVAGTTRDGRGFKCVKEEIPSEEIVYRATISDETTDNLDCFDGFNRD